MDGWVGGWLGENEKDDEGKEGWLSGCFAFLARAEHLRCKILNPGASAISPTSSGGRRVECETEDGGRGVIGESGKGCGGLVAIPPEGGGYGEAALRRALSKFTFKCKSAECR